MGTRHRFSCQCLLLFLLLAALGTPGMAAESGPPAGRAPAPAEVVREVPPPLPPPETVVPRGLEPGEWKTWAQGQQVNTLHRFAVRVSGWFGGSESIYAGTIDGEIVKYHHVFDGPTVGFMAEVAFAPLPVLSVSASFTFFQLSSNEYHTDIGGFPFRYHFRGMDILMPALHVKFRVPLAFWTLRSSHVRWSRCEEITGALFFVQLGAGPAMWSEVGADVEELGSGFSAWQDWWWETTNFVIIPSIGMDFRWDWGAISVAYTFLDFGEPNPASSSSAADSFENHLARLSFSLYF